MFAFLSRHDNLSMRHVRDLQSLSSELFLDPRRCSLRAGVMTAAPILARGWA